MPGRLAPTPELVEDDVKNVAEVADERSGAELVCVMKEIEELRRAHAVEIRARGFDAGFALGLLFSQELKEQAVVLLFVQAMLEPGCPSFGVGLGSSEAAPGHRVRSHAIRKPTPHTATKLELATI